MKLINLAHADYFVNSRSMILLEQEVLQQKRYSLYCFIVSYTFSDVIFFSFGKQIKNIMCCQTLYCNLQWKLDAIVILDIKVVI